MKGAAFPSCFGALSSKRARKNVVSLDSSVAESDAATGVGDRAVAAPAAAHAASIVRLLAIGGVVDLVSLVMVYRPTLRSVALLGKCLKGTKNPCASEASEASSSVENARAKLPRITSIS